MKLEINFAMSRRVTCNNTEGVRDHECKTVTIEHIFPDSSRRILAPFFQIPRSFFQLKALIVEDRVNKCE
jgi:hypothetical protein